MTSDLQNCKTTNLCCSKPLNRNRKLIQSPTEKADESFVRCLLSSRPAAVRGLSLFTAAAVTTRIELGVHTTHGPLTLLEVRSPKSVSTGRNRRAGKAVLPPGALVAPFAGSFQVGRPQPDSAALLRPQSQGRPCLSPYAACCRAKGPPASPSKHPRMLFRATWVIPGQLPLQDP